MKMTCSLFALLLSFSTYASGELLPCGDSLNELECKIYQETNRTRLAHGLGQLELLEECQEAAVYHVNSMAES